MARVTVEDCTKNVDSLFDLVLLASHRAKVLNAGNDCLLYTSDAADD